MADKFKIDMRPIDDLVPYARNPRKNDGAAVDKVAASIKEFGWRQPIVVDGEGVIIAGHTRHKAARQLGLTEVPVHDAGDLTETQARAFRIADNRTGDESTWDDELLRLEFDDIGDDIDLTGFDDEEIAALEPETLPPDGDPDATPDPPAEPVTVEGDLWTLGEHRVLCGDCTVVDAVERLIDGRQADLLVSDPPYGLSYVGKTKDALIIENDDLDENGLREMIDGAFSNALIATRPGAYWYATVPPGPLHLLFVQDWKDRGILRQIMVWVKSSMVMGHSEYHYKHEPIIYGWVPGGDRRKNPDRTRTTVWEYDRPDANRDHPTMKPVELFTQMILDSTNKNDCVFDPFLGSGTTLIAAESTGRVCYGTEIAPNYVDVIVKRWQTYTGREAVLDGDGRTFNEIAAERGIDPVDL